MDVQAQQGLQDGALLSCLLIASLESADLHVRSRQYVLRRQVQATRAVIPESSGPPTFNRMRSSTVSASSPATLT